jgi:hypothetical protein
VETRKCGANSFFKNSKLFYRSLFNVFLISIVELSKVVVQMVKPAAKKQKTTLG